jgi:signal transduction histidine kinase
MNDKASVQGVSGDDEAAQLKALCETLAAKNAELERGLRRHAGELDAANKELESFAYSISHDLRAPLRAIGGFSRIVLQDHGAQVPQEAREMLGTIVKSAQRMDLLIQDLLRFSRLGRQTLAKRRVDIAALARTVVDELKLELRAEELRGDEGGRTLDVRVEDVPDAWCDPALLKQVLVDLLSNAFKFTRARERAEVRVGCAHDGGYDAYFVKDNGVGFDARFAERLFGAFQRMHAADEFEGNGIGLAIVRRLIHRHGGRVWAEAEPEKGATFYFTLPE